MTTPSGRRTGRAFLEEKYLLTDQANGQEGILPHSVFTLIGQQPFPDRHYGDPPARRCRETFFFIIR